MSHLVGLSLGRAGEYSALAVLEQGRDGQAAAYGVRHLRRWPPGAPFAEAFAEAAALFDGPPLAGAPLVVDFAAAGRAAVELLRRAAPGADVVPVRVGAGRDAAADGEGGWCVPRAELAAVLRVLLQSGRLRVARALPDAAPLLRELEGFRLREAPAAEGPAAWRDGAGEALARAVAAAAWEGERRGPPCPGRPLVLGLGPAWRLGRW